MYCVCVDCVVLCIVCVDCVVLLLFVSITFFSLLFVSIALFYALFVCKCVLYYCHRVLIHLQLNIAYHTSKRLKTTTRLHIWPMGPSPDGLFFSQRTGSHSAGIHVPFTNCSVCRWFCVVHDPKPPLHSHNWLSFGKFQDTESFLIHCERHFSSRLSPSGGSWKYAKAPSTKKKKTWRDSLPIDMLLSAVSVLVVTQSSSEIPEGLMNNPVWSIKLLLDCNGIGKHTVS